jgi:tetratricopeptide (TPR) repeat protein
MICKKCGSYVPDDAYTCERCGTFQDADSFRISEPIGVRSIRQGRSSSKTILLPPRHTPEVREYADYEPMQPDLTQQGASMGRRAANAYAAGSRPEAHRGVPVQGESRTPVVKHRQSRTAPARRSNTNWALIGLIAIVLLIAAAVGYFIYMNESDEGHRITARKLVLEATPEQFELAVTRDPLQLEAQEELLREWTGIPAQSYWEVAEEYLNNGDLNTALTAYRLADIMDPENYDGLLLMASTQEMLGNADAAEQIYLQLSTEVSTIRTEAYTHLVRMYQDQGRRPEAAEIMRTAYNNTGRENFRLLREDYIPESPQVNLVAGRYDISTMVNDILITSPQGYDVYYTTDEKAILPEEGILADDGIIEPVEGSIRIRAVCISGDLVSDPLSVSYTFYYPTPPAPKCNLAPNTYKKMYPVELRPGKVEGLTKREQAEMEANLTYHYTIDGSTPTEDSPVYDGTPIKLPSGRVTLKAICINQYGKMSSTLEVGYKFDVAPYPKPMYGMKDSAINFEDDRFGGFELNKTTQGDFEAAFGAPRSVTETSYLTLSGPARHLEYDWGHAVFVLMNNQWQMVRMEMRSGFTSTPRGVNLGASLDEVTAAYKDFGQVMNPNGTRGLYFDFPRVGQYLTAEDGTKYVQYTAHTLESKMWVLQYWLEKGHVKRIVHFYQP